MSGRHCNIGSSSGSNNLAHKTNASHPSLKTTAEEQGGQPCEICGTSDARYLDQLLVCKCGAREHIYCMKSPLSKVPKVWVCGDCNIVKSMQPSYQSPNAPRRQFLQGKKKVKYLSLEEVNERGRSASSAQFRNLSTPPKMKFHSEKLQRGCTKSKNFVPKSQIKAKMKTPLSPLGIAKSAQRGYDVSKVVLHSNQASVEARKGTSSREQMELVTIKASMETNQPRPEAGNFVENKGDSHAKKFIPKYPIKALPKKKKVPNQGENPFITIGATKSSSAFKPSIRRS